MQQFLSTVTNRVDRKGRVSLPALFRTVVEARGFSMVVCYEAPLVPAIEGCLPDRMDEVSEFIDQISPLDPRRNDFATSILASARPLSYDREGRIVLPDDLKQFAGITEAATFVGQGRTFQIWEPEAFNAYQQEARERVLRDRDAFIWKRSAPTDAPAGGGS